MDLHTDIYNLDEINKKIELMPVAIPVVPQQVATRESKQKEDIYNIFNQLQEQQAQENATAISNANDRTAPQRATIQTTLDDFEQPTFSNVYAVNSDRTGD